LKNDYNAFGLKHRNTSDTSGVNTTTNITKKSSSRILQMEFYILANVLNRAAACITFKKKFVLDNLKFEK
jgi:hypothetical protein